MAQKSGPGPVYFLVIVIFAPCCQFYAERLRSRLSVPGAMPRCEAMFCTVTR